MTSFFCLNPYYTGIYLHHRETCGWIQWFVLILIILEYIYIKTQSNRHISCNCLNPYYTGIHLHFIIPQEVARNASLNPYYTGIHLHSSKGRQKSTLKSLNPYYTGIHLHVFILLPSGFLFIVLILIILEYIYIN